MLIILPMVVLGKAFKLLLHFNSMKKIQQLILNPELKIISKPSRTISGVAPVAIMSKPMKCPHGACIFCPGGPGSYFGEIPQSYTGNEPASMRALRNKFDAYLQVFNRLEHYALLQQDFSKNELIIMGGTFLAAPLAYQDDFIRGAFQAFNDFSMFFINGKLDFQKFKTFFELDGEFKNLERIKRVQERISALKKISSLKEEQFRNETSDCRVVALCLETKPDYCKQVHIGQALRLGCTRVELGVQSLYDDVLKFTNRGHDVEESRKATQLLKDSFLKVTYHMMPGLPLSSKEKDIEMMQEIFSDESYKPDSLKLYPCLVMPGTALHRLWKQGKFQEMQIKDAIDVLIEAKKMIPEYCRVMRVQRDIPTKVTAAGVDKTNLRQYLNEEMKRRGIKCRCIRCREPRGKEISWAHVKLKRLDYEASCGKEVFLSFEDVKNDLLLGFLRLRKPFKPFRKEISSKTAGVRELHVYGAATALGEEGQVQHRGLGKQLMQEAERIAAEEWDCRKILVISGVGVREYYRKLGYKNEGVYVSKTL